MKEATLLYPHQLFESHPGINIGRTIIMIEEPLMFMQYKFHKQKIMLHRASMQEYKDTLIKAGYDVVYIESDDIKKTEDIGTILKKHHITNVFVCEVVDDWLSRKLYKTLESHAIEYEILDTPLFITNQKQLDSYFQPLIEKNKKFLMRDFYIWQRKRLDILIEDGLPMGGTWSYDTENRKKLPKDITLPNNPKQQSSMYVDEARAYAAKNFSHHYGDTNIFMYPTNHGDAKKMLTDFLSSKLELFGPYEDAVTTKSAFVFHSILSPLINCGLLSPQYVVDETLRYAKKHSVSLPSLEGFLRQIIGWREYMRAVYVYHGRTIRGGNYFECTRAVPESFWNASTGIEPLDDIIRTVLTYAYAHHIPRLMIMGNFMNLAGFKPDDVYRWFMELFIDAYDWVMVPNVYSMALYADGGLITTKPYIASSNYILKMSDYKKGDWALIWDSLFWNFVGVHFKKLSAEGRLGFIGIQYQKMSEDKKEFHAANAKKYFKSV